MMSPQCFLGEAVKLYIAVTDNKWFAYLRERAPLEEVDFWLPSPRQGFAALQVGEPFLFKLHAPMNYIVGGGFFTHYTRAPVYMAWEAFGTMMGAGSFREVHSRIARYRRQDAKATDFEIGNVILTEPFFLKDEHWVRAPSDWSPNIVRGKTYETEAGEGARIWDEVLPHVYGEPHVNGEEEPSSEGKIAENRVRWVHKGPIRGEPVPVRQRLGQGAFRVLVADAYGRRCAITGEKALPTLDAAHIRPVSEGGLHRVENGLFLRTDIHRLYDRGYVTVTPDLRFRVSQALHADFDNGEPYFPLDGAEISVPDDERDRPSRDLLEWHADVLFRG